ncbi:hypothetical protein B1400_0536 [Bifidobacterium italicum]|uniref:DUF3152 domain-containing protein n=2 Tax=Bifidobacterium italicum TaxID=1960968 RepID=A0A2A2EL79_9BIFI|nr:hypothetical protein B1400_0536 [Bifidobacterium italicum]
MGGANMNRASRRRRHRRLRRRYVVRRVVAAVALVLLVVGVAASTGASVAHVTATPDEGGAATANIDFTKALRMAFANGQIKEPEPLQPKSDEDRRNEAARQELDALAAPMSAEQRKQIYDKAKQTAEHSGAQVTKMTYCVATNGDVGDKSAFANTVDRALNDPRGWPRAGVVFQQVDGGCDVTVTLAAPEKLPTYSTYCSSEYSCRVGADVIINKKRWDGAVDHWFQEGGTLASYRTMVVNHEVGHALGHLDNEQPCGGDGQKAPLMQEQSMFLNGCTVNPWPLDSELWTTFVGSPA